MSAPSLAWFAGHELRLTWRDWTSMMTGGRPARRRAIIIGLLIVAALMHLLAYAMVIRFAEAGSDADKEVLVAVTGTAILSFALMLSQAMEAVTRVFYARSDLELILSSPASTRRLFAVRIGVIAVTTGLMAILLAAPFINVLVLRGGPRWLSAYGAVLGLGIIATSLAVAMTVGMFRLFGPKRTRLIAQIVAAIIGAGFVIGLQATAILTTGSISRFSVFNSEPVIAQMPDVASFVYIPARAILGDPAALATLLFVAAALLALVIGAFSHRFADKAIAAAGADLAGGRRRRSVRFRGGSAPSVLRRKELLLLRRDPWLVSQTLMQILYLLPPALLLWRNFGNSASAMLLLVPVLVMAGGQLAGGLAWLAVSGEDAPDLVATAPIAHHRIILAKIETVIAGVALVFAPVLAAMAFASPRDALIAAAFIAIASASATTVQLWFRVQARRSQFRRRQTSSRVATLAEAFSSLLWAGTAALVAGEARHVWVPALLALSALGIARLLRPKEAGA